MKAIEAWQPVVDTFASRLSLWKAKNLSIGGRLVLIKAILDSLPVYFFSLYKAPKGILKKLDALRMNFLWGSKNNRLNIHWVNKDEVTCSLKNGGLSLVPLEVTNQSLLSKWVWRYHNEPERLWRIVVRSIHGYKRDITFLPCKKIFCGNWRTIVTNEGMLRSKNINFQALMVPDAAGYEWTGDNTCRFSVKSVRKLHIPDQDTADAGSIEWSGWVPKRVNILGWRVNRGRVATYDELVRKKVHVGSLICPLCKEQNETADHVFTACRFTTHIWNLITQWCKTKDIFVFHVTDIFKLHATIRMNNNKRKFFHVVVLVAVWCIWRERNKVVFNNKRPSIDYVMKEVKEYSFLWVRSRNKTKCIYWLD